MIDGSNNEKHWSNRWNHFKETENAFGHRKRICDDDIGGSQDSTKKAGRKEKCFAGGAK